MSRTVKEIVADAKARIENLTARQVDGELRSGRVVLVDLREPGEREQHGTIAGALPAPRGMLEFYADPTSPYRKPELDPPARTIVETSCPVERVTMP